MRSLAGTLAAPFPYFGGKSLACETVWAALGNPENYVEPFAGSAAMPLNMYCVAQPTVVAQSHNLIKEIRCRFSSCLCLQGIIYEIPGI